MATRPIISYDDITLPYEPVDESAPIPSTSSNHPPPSKKRKANNQKPKQHQRQRHWDDPGKSSTVNYDAQHPHPEDKENNLESEEEESRELTHEEIWDDSALIDAWNSAMEEYEAYNGPDKGWKKDPIHKSPLWYNNPPAKIATKSTTSTENNVETNGTTSMEGKAAEDDSQPLNFDTFVPTHDPALNHGKAPVHSADESYVPLEGVGTSVSRDEAFKNALNATYWAGYWTAMYYCQGRSSQKQFTCEDAKNLREDDGENKEPADEEVEVEDEFVPTQR
ncbi:hypothetical protein BDQ17DRAFT_1350298 [Cyathus striatus]|nr:hypothetical protein BDQ17DRAFT_1350298 [Cyathus striatus]